MPSSNSVQVKDPKSRGEEWFSLIGEIREFMDFFNKVYESDLTPHQRSQLDQVINLLEISFQNIYDIEKLTQYQINKIKNGILIEARRIADQASIILNQNL